MRVTRTIDVEVCDCCGSDDKTCWRLFTCLGCLKEVCRSCVNHFNVEVRFNEPHQPTENFPHRSITVSYPQRYQLRGSFCADCEGRILILLRTAGLTESKASQEHAATLDAFQLPVPHIPTVKKSI